LIDRIEALPILKPHLISIYEEPVQGIADPQVKVAVKRLIVDSRGRPSWFYRRLRRWRRKAGPNTLRRIWEAGNAGLKNSPASILGSAGTRLGLRGQLGMSRRLGQQIVDLGHGARLVELLHRGDLARHAVERSFVELPL
jgi:hypothetical protein